MSNFGETAASEAVFLFYFLHNVALREADPDVVDGARSQQRGTLG